MTAESQVSCGLVSLSCHCFSCALAPMLLFSSHGLTLARGHKTQVLASSLPPICWASPWSRCPLRCWPHTRYSCIPVIFLGRVPGCCQGSVTFEVPLLYISQEALGPGKHAEKEFLKNPPGDNCGNGVSLGKETVPSEEGVGFLVYSVPAECFITPLGLGLCEVCLWNFRHRKKTCFL